MRCPRQGRARPPSHAPARVAVVTRSAVMASLNHVEVRAVAANVAAASIAHSFLRQAALGTTCTRPLPLHRLIIPAGAFACKCCHPWMCGLAGQRRAVRALRVRLLAPVAWGIAVDCAH